jgi:predicted nucleotidyltransferase
MRLEPMISEQTIEEAVARLVEAAKPQKIFLFGSYARGDAHKQSDLDFLVVKREAKNRRKETVHLQDTLRPMRIPVDILVVSEAAFNEWEDVIGTVFNEIKREGILCYDASQADQKVLA